MADERFKWLDEDVAEQLLRGEPLDAVDDDAHARAGRLSSVLGAARAAHHPQHEELPGEEAAVAAFRQATGASGATVRGGGATVAAVRVAGGRGRPTTSRWGRPVRFGLAATLAACTLGGVAMAAGAGVIPTPFGGRSEPGPASSVSAVATPPDPLSSPSTDPSEPGIAGSGTPEPDDEEQDEDRPRTDGGHPSEGDHHKPPQDDGDQPSTGGGRDQWSPGEWYEQAVDACRDHRAGRPLEPSIQRKLEKAAKSSADVKRFCDRLLDRDGGQSGGSGEHRPGDGQDDGDDSDGDGASGKPTEPGDDPSSSDAPDPPAGFAPPADKTPSPSATSSPKG
ncbi:hypothetical protein DSC45_01885 [Streptomyces sp. YIM 130001]|uniref:hypothetical protein n=1 Tax=Streptomyces sp. YIM 130001 TaxID=2259644 RepID=UPI000E64892D|nr:hypothetical protein [Streptomyces sp. YIM 130001]RII20853.1 hypothetical protein DSC45_01885 [Streptomyces sp. YIM 130001]